MEIKRKQPLTMFGLWQQWGVWHD